MVVAAEIHTATHFSAEKIVIPTAARPLASTFWSHTLPNSPQLHGLEDSNITYNDVWSCQTPKHNRPEEGGSDGFPQPFSKSLLHNVLVECALLVSQSLGEDSLLQLCGWSTITTESRSLWCILWTCIVDRRIGQTGRFLIAIGLGAIKTPKHLVCHHHRP